MKRKAKYPGYTRLLRANKMLWTKILPSGAEVRVTNTSKDAEEFEAFDSNRRYLGFTRSQEEAETMATEECPNSLEEASELELWGLWNALIDRNRDVVEAEDGKQFVFVRDGVFIQAESDVHGYSLQFISESVLREMYSHPKFPQILRLKITSLPMRPM